MRKHGWQLPYHPLQVVAVAVFLALGFAFYVFFVPFVGKQLYQYIVIGIYTPLIVCAFGLYIWCAAADPADPGVFKSKKYINFPEHKKHDRLHESKLGGESTSSIHDANAATVGVKSSNKEMKDMDTATEDRRSEIEEIGAASQQSFCFKVLLALLTPCAFVCNCSNSHDESSGQQASEDGMFYCSLCEVEVYKYSKHCRVCDKCVDRFDHHCRWLNNCIGKRNYRKFFLLMVSALLLLILQWSTGIMVLIRCFLEHKRFSEDIATKLGSSFSIVPYVIVVAMCTILAMVATLPVVQLFFFHILLIKKGISTYDYIIALREQEQGVGGQQSPQMSQASSITGLSSASSFRSFQQGAWCTPPQLFVEDQFDVVPSDTRSVSSLGKKTVGEEMKKSSAPVKISPWTLARLNAEDVSRAAAEARRKSKILQPVTRRDVLYRLDRDNNFSSSDRHAYGRQDYNRKRGSTRVRLPAEFSIETLTKVSTDTAESNITETSTNLAPRQHEARSAFRTSLAMSNTSGVVTSSPESSLDSPDLHPFGISSTGVDEARRLTAPSSAAHAPPGFPLSRSASASDGYDASGGEDSDRVPSRAVQRPTNWSNVLFDSVQDESIARVKGPGSSGYGSSRNSEHGQFNHN